MQNLKGQMNIIQNIEKLKVNPLIELYNKTYKLHEKFNIIHMQN